MSWSYRLLTPRLVEEDLGRPSLLSETRLALQTLRTLLERPDGVDEGVVRGQIDTALQDPSMVHGVLHSLFRTDDTRDMHTLYAAMDSMEQQMAARQRESCQDVRTMLQFIRTVLLTPMHRDRPTLRQDMLESLLTSFGASNVPFTDALSDALHRLTLGPMTLTAQAPSAGTPVPHATNATASFTSQMTSHIGDNQDSPHPGAVGAPANVPVPSPVSPPSTFPSAVNSGTHASAFVPLGQSSQGGGISSGANPTVPTPAPLTSPGRASTSPTLLEVLQAIDPHSPPPPSPSSTHTDDSGLHWLHTQMSASPAPVLSASQVVLVGTTVLPLVQEFKVVRVTLGSEGTADAVAKRCGLEVTDVAQYWSMHHPFDMTPLPSQWNDSFAATCVEVPLTSVGSTEVHTFEVRVVSRHFEETLEWSPASHSCLMKLLTHVTGPPPTAETVSSESIAKKPNSARSRLCAPGPPPPTITDRHLCLQRVLEGVDVNACIRQQVPLLRLRHVHKRPVLEWCIIIKPLDANGHLRVFRLNNKPNNRYVSVAPTDVYIALDIGPAVPYHAHYVLPDSCRQTSASATNVNTGPFEYTHTLEVLNETQIHADDNRLHNTIFVVHPTERPSKLFTPNMFGGYLLCGWYNGYDAAGCLTSMYVFQSAPRTVYLHREVTVASV